MSTDPQPHPGTITFNDRVTGRTWTEAVADVPETMAWANTPGGREAVVRIEITGEEGHRRSTRFSASGEMLDTTVQAPPPRPAATPAPVPQLIPEAE